MKTSVKARPLKKEKKEDVVLIDAETFNTLKEKIHPGESISDTLHRMLLQGSRVDEIETRIRPGETFEDAAIRVSIEELADSLSRPCIVSGEP